MTDVHRFGDVGRGEIDDDGARIGHRFETQSIIAGGLLHACRVDFRLDAEVDESRPGDLRSGDVVRRPGGDDLFRQRARVHLARLCQHHRGVRLIIAEAQIRRRADSRGCRFAQLVG